MSDHFAAFSFVDRITRLRARRARARLVRGAARDRRISVVPGRRGRRPARGVGRDGASSTFAAGRSRRWRPRRVFEGERRARRSAGARRRHRRLRRRSRRLRRLGEGRRPAGHRAQALPGSDAAGRGASIRRRRCASASRCCAVAARRPGRFRGVAPVPLTVDARVPGKSLHATLDVPEHAAFFGDHFPRRPVFPATLAARRADAACDRARRFDRRSARRRGDDARRA